VHVAGMPLKTGNKPAVDSKSSTNIPLYCYRQRKHPETATPENVIDEILASMPQEVYKPRWIYALLDLGIAALLIIASVVVFTKGPWPLLPLGWILAGLAMCYLFNIGHDCAHKTWTPSELFNSIVGEIAFLPLIHPFQAFRYKHLYNNRLLHKTDLAHKDSPLASHANSLLASLGLSGFLAEHYNLATFPDKFKPRVAFSIFLSIVFNILFFGLIGYYCGLQGILFYWLVPLVLYKDVVYFPWLEWARRKSDVHFPSRVASAVPSYHLRNASLCVQEYFERGNKEKSESLYALHQDAMSQKEGSNSTGYNHEYGDEVRGEGFKSIGEILRNVNWVNAVILIGTPIMAIVGICTVPIQTKTLVFSIFYYFFTGLGITAGYHRLWAHRAYQAGALMKILLLLGGTGALEGSIKWWCGDHRVHHRYTDTPKDPYNARFGFWWSHMGWMLMKPDRKYKIKADVRDLMADPLIKFQHDHYLWLGPLLSFVIPSLIAGLGWGDYVGGYFFAGACRQVFVHHSTFCVNSMAHFFGSHTFDDTRTPRDHFFTAICTLGEGYHNFHHEFPCDYRNGIRYFDYDPTKWLIKFGSLFGLTWALKEFPANEVMKGKLLMMQKKLDHEKAKLVYPGPVAALPPMTWELIQRRVREGQMLVVIEGLIHDVSDFAEEHPGGLALLQGAVGQDATARFKGETGVYKHSNAARHLLTTFRVGRLVDVLPPEESHHYKSA